MDRDIELSSESNLIAVIRSVQLETAYTAAVSAAVVDGVDPALLDLGE